MATEKFANKPITTLNGGINGVVTALTVTDASTFPSSPQFRILIESEILLVTGVSGANYTVQRGAEGTSNVPHSNGVAVIHILTAGALDQLKLDISSMVLLAGVSSQGTATPIRVGSRESIVTQTMTLVVQLETTAGTAHAGLWDATSSTLITDLNTTNTTSTRLTASGLSIVTGHLYELQIWLVGGNPAIDRAIATYGELV